MGGELIRVLVDHPDAEVSWITSRGDKSVERYHRNLYGMGLRFTKPEQMFGLPEQTGLTRVGMHPY